MLRRPLLIASAIALSAPALALAAARAALVIDDDLSVYRSVVTAISGEARAEIDEYDLQGHASRAPAILADIRSRLPAAVITVGPQSAVFVSQAGLKTPLIHCLVPNAQDYALQTSQSALVLMEPSLGEQFSLLKSLAPRVKRVGVVHDRQRARASLEKTRGAARAEALELVMIEVSRADEIAAGLRRLSGDVDALWTLADPTALSLAGLDALSDFSRREKIPL